MAKIKDGHIYRVVNMGNHLLLAYGIDQMVPGCWLTAQSSGDTHYESRFRAIACPGNKWKFAVVNNSKLCVGFQGAVSGGLQILDDGGDCHTVWVVDRGNGPNLVEIHAHTDNGEVCWAIPGMGPPGAVVELTGIEGSPEQQWKLVLAGEN